MYNCSSRKEKEKIIQVCNETSRSDRSVCYLFLAMSGIQDLSSLTRDQTQAP